MCGIYCTEARGHKAARGLSAINAMHPECTCYNYFISRGHWATIVTELVNQEVDRLARYKDAACARHEAAV